MLVALPSTVIKSHLYDIWHVRGGVESSTGASQEALDVSSSVDTRAAPDALQEAATLISKHVQRLIPRVCHHLAADDR